jgi:hypothetical protein
LGSIEICCRYVHYLFNANIENRSPWLSFSVVQRKTTEKFIPPLQANKGKTWK